MDIIRQKYVTEIKCFSHFFNAIQMWKIGSYKTHSIVSVELNAFLFLFSFYLFEIFAMSSSHWTKNKLVTRNCTAENPGMVQKTTTFETAMKWPKKKCNVTDLISPCNILRKRWGFSFFSYYVLCCHLFKIAILQMTINHIPD